MGFSGSMIAIDHKDATPLLEVFELTRTGKWMDFFSGDFAVSQHGDYAVLWLNDPYMSFERMLLSMSLKHRVLALHVNDTVMWSGAVRYDGGQVTWQVFHDSQEGTEHLSTIGRLPENFQAIKAAAVKAQTEAKEEPDEFRVDYFFDVPVDLFNSIVDADYRVEYEQELEAVSRKQSSAQAPKDKPWWNPFGW
ncbi:hypothetical protein [Pontibacter sp. G13]|uniref:hypothetical protein n=1 Tax=Pontibacter sp. G13 TaxID=3074898 RepID=UPI00288A9CCE|nr:hypothetical protein [Pontibacter sp. G13]WNJ18794.1 hypothetical protein RJD25_28390 [Pontibacter sp. G13]